MFGVLLWRAMEKYSKTTTGSNFKFPLFSCHYEQKRNRERKNVEDKGSTKDFGESTD